MSERIELSPEVVEAFGTVDTPIAQVEAGIRALFPARPLIVWEGDPQTFQFSYVGGDAAQILGYPASAWTTDPKFWVEHIVHGADRDDAVAFCALATARGTDHEFEYRAQTADGGQVWLRDLVRVLLGQRRIPVLLRGVMFDVTAEKTANGIGDTVPDHYVPSPASLREAR